MGIAERRSKRNCCNLNRISFSNFFRFKILHPILIKTFTKVTPSLYVIANEAVTDQKLVKTGINILINATNSIELYNPGTKDLKTSVHILRLPINDMEGGDLAPYFLPISELIKANAELGGKTLIHCRWGKSRSVSLCVSYLILYGVSQKQPECRMTVSEALRSIKAKRRFAKPNNDF